MTHGVNKLKRGNVPEDRCTHTLREEGGTWAPLPVDQQYFPADMGKPYMGSFHAYKFLSGRIWDQVNGWREESSLPLEDALADDCVVMFMEHSRSDWKPFTPGRCPLRAEYFNRTSMYDIPHHAYEFESGRVWMKPGGWLLPKNVAPIRTFETGATRDVDHNKPDYEAYLSPLVIERFGQYMLSTQIQADGTRREGDNWQKGMPIETYMKSGWRHHFDWWKLHRTSSPLTPEGNRQLEEALCALIFNASGYLHEHLKKKEPE